MCLPMRRVRIWKCGMGMKGNQSIDRSINADFSWDQSVLCHEPMSATDSILRTYKTVHMFPRYKAIQDLEILRLF